MGIAGSGADRRGAELDHALRGWAAAMAGAGQRGGDVRRLVFAAIKRDKGVKDWSHLVPVRAGSSTSSDSVIFAAPVFTTFTHPIWG